MSKFDKSIRKVIEHLNSFDYLQTSGIPSSLNPPYSFKKLCLTAGCYRDIYDEAVNHSIFNAMMADGAFFQFSEAREASEIRLAYYPKPPETDNARDDYNELTKWLEEGLINSSDFDQLLSEIQGEGYCTLIRYDLSTSQYCENFHPAAHLHIGHFGDNRWPVRRILNPESFFWMIIFNCYPNFRKSAQLNSDFPCPSTLYLRALSQTNFLPTTLFSEAESSRLSIG